MTETKIVIIQHVARGEGITGTSISRPQKSTLNLRSPIRSVMQKTQVMGRPSKDIIEEKSESEIKMPKPSRSETVDPLSLNAQFWDHADERVAQAAVDVLERVQW